MNWPRLFDDRETTICESQLVSSATKELHDTALKSVWQKLWILSDRIVKNVIKDSQAANTRFFKVHDGYRDFKRR